ncbi:MAG: hypothetical protein ABL900_14740 [Burkholderiaceae bacterium]
MLRTPLAALLIAALGGTATVARSQGPSEGFLCCNLRSDGSWISDVNYVAGAKQTIPAGTPVKVTGFGRYRVFIEFDGKKQALGNDYSRTVKMEEFAQRYIVPQDPWAALRSAPPKVRDAVKNSRISRGMTRAQVLMALGYPIASATPDLDAPLWRYWTSSSAEYQVFWGEDGRVDKIFGAAATRALVELE